MPIVNGFWVNGPWPPSRLPTPTSNGKIGAAPNAVNTPRRIVQPTAVSENWSAATARPSSTAYANQFTAPIQVCQTFNIVDPRLNPPTAFRSGNYVTATDEAGKVIYSPPQ